MEGLLETQAQTVEAMQQLRSNFKKDGQDRKTADYIRKRLATFDSYWQEFKHLHEKLTAMCDSSHPYVAEKRFEQVLEFYNNTRAMIQSYTPPEEVIKPSTPVIKPSMWNLGGATSSRANPNQNKDPEMLEKTKSQGSSSKLEEMLRKQASNFRAFNRTVDNIDLNSATEKWELEDILKTLQARWSIIDNLHWELDSELEGTDEDYEIAFSGNERVFNSMKKDINSKIFNAGHREYSTPKLEIPVFSGNYQQWVSFKDLFTEAIHNNRSLSSAQKMQFLKGKIRGEAERLIQHLQISSDNYSICWEILNHRYNNQKLIFTAHISTIMNLPISQQQSMTHIKRVHDITVESINAIKSLGVDVSTWDPIIVHIISQKLDSETHNKYVQSLTNPRDLPKLEELLGFLESTFTSMEVSRKKQDFSQVKSGQSNQQNPFGIRYQNPKFIKQSYTSHQAPKTSAGPQSFSNKNFNSPKQKCPVCSNDHGLYHCENFLSKAPQTKRRVVQSLDLCQNCLFNHNGKPCISQKTCRECNGDHNTILHEAFVPESAIKPNQMFYKKSGSEQQPVSKNNLHVSRKNDSNEVLLATAIIKVQAADGTYKQMRALIDQGSQACLISENAAQRLSLPRQGCKGSIFGVGAKESTCKGVINITCAANDNTYSFHTPAFIMNQLIKQLPNQSFQMPSWTFLENMKLADPEFNISRPVDILLGADIYSNIILSGIYKQDEFSPIVQQTRLGWILCGSTKTYQCNVVLNNIDELKQFWQIEDITDETPLSVEDNYCVQFYKRTTKRRNDGSYEVRLPMKENFESKLGQSKKKAIAQFQQVERKFYKHINIANGYKQFINEYVSLGHMTPADGNKTPECYLPHHSVLRADSTTTSLRVVFNASAPTSTGLSLNDVMYPGPNLQQNLLNLILKWRQYEFALTADIEKMFRQIWAHQEDQRLQKIIWRDSPNTEFKECTQIKCNDVKANKGRGIKTNKAYISIFVCMATKAVHIELVSDMSTSAFLAALRRMAARRGAPRHIYSDNGTNFVGASRIIEQEMHAQQQNNQEFMTEITEMGITWHFNAPSWPSAGGLWEAAVKSLKYHIKRVIGEQKLTYEEYATLLTQLEACLNSRPLCALTEDVEDLNFLTPGHFLTGTGNLNIINTEHDARTRWQLTEKLFQDLWKRWKSEYLTQLTTRSKWLSKKPSLNIGDLVTIHDDHTPPGKWPMGRIIDLHPGKDGLTRVVSLKTKNGTMKRPICKLSVLPVNSKQECIEQARKDSILSKSSKTGHTRRPGLLMSSLSIMLMIFGSLFTSAVVAEEYSINPLGKNQSLYFDSMSNMKIIRDDWKLIAYYNMDPYWEGIQILAKYLKHMDLICTKLNGDAHCETIMLQLRHNSNELEHFNQILLGQHEARARQRRGLVNGVGYVAHSLFGVLDEHFAEQYQKDITLVRENHPHLASLLKNQTSIVEAEYNMIKRIEQIMQKQRQHINNHLESLDKSASFIRTEIEQIATVNDFTSSAIIANNILINLKSIQDSLGDTITNIDYGRLNVHLFKPGQLQEELNTISGHLTKDTTLPIENLQNNPQRIYRLLKVKARLQKNT